MAESTFVELVAREYKKVARIHKRRTEPEKRISDRHRELFHYTTVSALRGILESGSLWATHAAYLNDSSELKAMLTDFAGLLTKAFEESIDGITVQRGGDHKDELMKMRIRIAKGNARPWINGMRSRLVGDSIAEGIASPFVFSFTKHQGGTRIGEYRQRHGMLSQWRAYGGSEPVAIVFDTEGIERLVEDMFQQIDSFSCYFKEVIYGLENVSIERHSPHLFRAISDFAANCLEESGSENQNNKQQRIWLESMRNATQAVLEFAGRIKHIGFEEEEEARIVVTVPNMAFREEPGGGVASSGKPAVEVFFRKGKIDSIPYIKLINRSCQHLPISRIVVGPSRNQEAHVDEVNRILGRRGEEITVQRSEIPFVSSA